jgi:hypothetical protein
MDAQPSTRPSLLVRLRDMGDELAWSDITEIYGPLVHCMSSPRCSSGPTSTSRTAPRPPNAERPRAACLDFALVIGLTARPLGTQIVPRAPHDPSVRKKSVSICPRPRNTM